MSKQALIAILDGCPDGAETPDGIRLLHLGRFTAALATDMSGVFSLLPNRRQALQQAVQRQAQLEQCMRLGTVLPVRPSAHLDDAAVQAFVTANAEILAGVSQRVRHAQQFQVTVKWTASDVLSHFRDAPEIAPLFAGKRTTAPALQAAITRLATRLHALMQQEISAVAQDMILLPHTDDVIFNTVLLVAEGDVFNLDLAVERIDAIWPEGFAIRQIGPAPASSFALIDPMWVSADQVAEAHATLGLPNGPDADAIANARRAALMQPGCDADHIRRAAQTVHAAAQLDQIHDGIHMCLIRADGQSEIKVHHRDVA